MLIIDIKEKKYNKEDVLKDLSLIIKEPGIYGLIGKNGAGKTTFFKCALGLEKFTGVSSLYDKKLSLNNTAFCPTEPFVYDELTAAEFYNFYANLFALSSDKNTRKLFELSENELIKNFSPGMKKKAYLNAVFQKKFQVYFLDEPFNGLDIESNYILINDLKEKAKDSIIIVSSHIFEILYKLCDKIYLLSDKKLVRYEQDNYEALQDDFLNKNN